VDLLEKGEIGEEGGDVRVARAEAVDQPLKTVEFGDAVDLTGIFVEHDE
jgi:hypothetical protein